MGSPNDFGSSNSYGGFAGINSNLQRNRRVLNQLKRQNCCLSKQSATDAAGFRDISWSVKDIVTDTTTQIPAGNKVVSSLLENKTLAGFVILNNLPIQNIPFDPPTGTLDFTANGGLKDGDQLTVLYS